MKENYVIFRFETSEFIVKYTCSKDCVSKEDIENRAVSYSDSETFYKDIIHDIMSSFDGVEYEIINGFDKYIDME